MDQIERRDRELAYITDHSVMEEQARCRKILQRLNFMDRSDFDGIAEVVRELLGKSENAFINPPFYCDYGTHIEVGKNFFANYNCTILDVAKVKIGDYCQMAPNVAIYTAGHPVHPDSRNSLYEYGKAITIGDNVWIGGNTVILPGITIGNNVANSTRKPGLISSAAALPRIKGLLLHRGRRFFQSFYRVLPVPFCYSVLLFHFIVAFPYCVLLFRFNVPFHSHSHFSAISLFIIRLTCAIISGIRRNLSEPLCPYLHSCTLRRKYL